LEKEIDELKEKLEEHEKRIVALERIIKKRPSKLIFSGKKSVNDLLLELKNEGFFDEDKTISQIKDALHAKGRIIKVTSLPRYLLRLVRNDMLRRTRKLVGKKKFWVYHT